MEPLGQTPPSLYTFFQTARATCSAGQWRPSQGAFRCTVIQLFAFHHLSLPLCYRYAHIVCFVYVAYPEPVESLPSPPQPVRMVYAKADSSVTLACNLRVSALANFNITWLYTPTGSSYLTMLRTVSDPDYGLSLHSISQSDSGIYQCRVNAKTFPDNPHLPSNSHLECQLGSAVNLTVEQYSMYSVVTTVIKK